MPHGELLQIEIPPSIVGRVIFKNFQKSLARLLTPRYGSLAMPNQHAPDKAPIAFYVTRQLKRAVETESARLGMTITSFCEWVLFTSTKHVTLTSNDHREIADQIEKHIKGLKIPDQRLRSERAKKAAAKSR